MKMLKRTWAEVSLDALQHNYQVLTKDLPEGCRFLGVVKADAYGHGAVPVARSPAGSLPIGGCFAAGSHPE